MGLPYDWLVRERMLGRVPLGRIGIPEDIANLVVFLVSEQSSYITGQGVDICGGWGLVHG
jgi:3-oxoacyl-[acyl-carrier protein] reductase